MCLFVREGNEDKEKKRKSDTEINFYFNIFFIMLFLYFSNIINK